MPAPEMLLEPLDPNERFRSRRDQARRRRAIRRVVLLGLVVVAAAAVALGMSFLTGRGGEPVAAGDASGGPAGTSGMTTAPAPPEPAPLPSEIRGVHVTMALASIPGKLGEYLSLTGAGLTALQLDVKDENGEVAFRRPAVPLARAVQPGGRRRGAST